MSWEAGAPGHGSISCQPHHGRGEACAQGADCWALSLLEDSSKDLKLLIKHLLELLALEGASAHGRDNALNLLIKVVPRKSPKETNNSMSLWVIDQGEQNSLQHPTGASCPSASGCCTAWFHPCTPFALQRVFDLHILLGLKKILEVGSTVCGTPGSLPVTENSRMSASVLLSKLYDDLKCDAERENFHHLCEDYVR